MLRTKQLNGQFENRSYLFLFTTPGMEHNSTQYIHLLAETLRLSFTDALRYCADPEKADVPIQELLSKEYAAKRRELIRPDRYVLDFIAIGL